MGTTVIVGPERSRWLRQDLGVPFPGLIRPFRCTFPEQDIAELQCALREILSGGSLALGRHTAEFEENFAAYVGVPHAVAVSSGTAGLEILLRIHEANGLRIAVPTNTNFATVAAILHSGATPVFIDMTPATFMPDVAVLSEALSSSRIDGVVWVHIGGMISPDFLKVVALCRSKSIFLIEDAAHAHGSRFGGIHAGAFSDGGAFSFFATKVMTTMEGGMIVTTSPKTAQLARSYRDQGKSKSLGGEHHYRGSSWGMTEISAAIGIVQLRRLDEMIGQRCKVARKVEALLTQMSMQFCRTDHMDQSSYYKVVVHLPHLSPPLSEIRNKFRSVGVELGGCVYELPCHKQPVFRGLDTATRPLDVSERLCPRHICPPITAGMTDLEVQKLLDSLVYCLCQGR